MQKNGLTHILFLATIAELGGAQRYIYDLASNLFAPAFAVTVAAGGDGPLFSTLAQRNIATQTLRHLRRAISPLHDLAAIFEIRRLLKRLKPDILHLNSSKAGVLGSLAAYGLPIRVVYTAHGFVFNEPLPRWLAATYRILERKTAKYKDVIICVSEADRQAALTCGIAPRQELVTIHNGIAAALDFYPKEKARQILSTTYYLPLTTFKLLIGVVANLYPTKGIGDFVAMAERISVKHPGATFVVIGEGQDRPVLERTISKHRLRDIVFLVGAIPEAAKLIPAFDLYCVTSKKEGLPYAILEAMAAGLPIVATAVGGVPELINDQRTGELVPAGDVAALSHAVEDLLQDPTRAQQLGQAARERVRRKFSLAAMVEQTIACYQRILKLKR